MGLQGGSFHWWEGVVEDNLDPTGAGRCKVRVIGHNTPLKEELSRVELPWAYPVLPLNNPHGKIVGLKPGTRVMGFYRDGQFGQDLVMMGTINTGYGGPSGFNENEEPVAAINLANKVPRIGDIGFVDDREGAGGVIEDQPKKTVLSVEDGILTYEEITDYGSLKINEINTPRLARGIVEETATKAHQELQALTKVVKTDASEIPEPENPYDALYPFNTVEESDSGHLKEVDDTPGAERIKETHRTGTFYEIHPDGTKVTKVVKDDFSVTIGDKGVKVDGMCAVHVVGQADFYCESDIKIKTDMNADITVAKNVTAEVGENLLARVAKNARIVGETVDVIASGAMNIEAGGEITFADSTATASNVDEIIRDIDEGIRVDA